MLLRAVPLGSPGSALPAGVSTPGELERGAAILDPVRRHEFLAGRLALRGLVAEATGVDPMSVVSAYTCPECGLGEHGVPGFALASSGPIGKDSAHDAGRRLPLDLAASMSRARGWALLAVQATGAGSHDVGVTPWRAGVTPWGAEVTPWGAQVWSCEPAKPGIGVDLACVADFRQVIPQAAFSVGERRRLSRSGDPAAEAARLWARKEALLKALGTGLRGDPTEVEAVRDPRLHDLNAHELGLPEGFVAALAFS
ncbi:hypothetical protein GCM10027449_14030 [Sinomonas notoginsengisoli]|uniref:4'-phosphopantetheinyl transferase family protein n=1 Tax=Sinomonas notoginsengisoli TaxID=1457311 RepID=UPI001F348B8B|nr:4'-phosphopantetheinyl transferase superfamily protein [Sinomonas notoginsengisoli]